MKILLSLLFGCFYISTLSASTSGKLNLLTIKKVLRLKITDSSQSKCEALVIFKKGYSASYQEADGDAPSAGGVSVSVSSLTSDNRSMAMNQMPELGEVPEVKLKVNSRYSQNVVLSVEELPFTDNYKFVLTDKFLNVSKTLADDFSYEFFIDKSNESTYGADRFTISISSTIDVISDDAKDVNLENPVLSIYPNPSVNELHVDSKVALRNVEATIYNYSGVLVKKVTINDAMGIDVRNLAPQYYILVLREGEKRLLVTKFLKE